VNITNTYYNWPDLCQIRAHFVYLCYAWSWSLGSWIQELDYGFKGYSFRFGCKAIAPEANIIGQHRRGDYPRANPSAPYARIQSIPLCWRLLILTSKTKFGYFFLTHELNLYASSPILFFVRPLFVVGSSRVNNIVLLWCFRTRFMFSWKLELFPTSWYNKMSQSRLIWVWKLIPWHVRK